MPAPASWTKGGNDTLTGFAGDDRFIFSTKLGAGNVDTITDFTNAAGNNDSVWLSKTVFAALTGATSSIISADQFAANASGAATTADQHIVYNSTTGALFYDADGNTENGVAAVQFATLNGHPTIVNADFLLFA